MHIYCKFIIMNNCMSELIDVCVCVCVLQMTTVTTGELLELAEKNVKLEVVEDMAEQFEEAYKLYMKALEYAGTYLFYENNPWLKKKNRQLFLGHYRRATKIRGLHHLHGPSFSNRAESGLGLTESNVKLSDVGGLEACKEVLVEAAIVPIQNPQFFTGKFSLHHCI